MQSSAPLPHFVRKQAGLPTREAGLFYVKTRRRYWRGAGVAVLAVMGEETRLASLVLL